MPFTNQPPSCRLPLEPKPHIKTMSFVLRRIYETDPSIFYARITSFDIYARHYAVPISVLFPPIEGLCSCGCGKELSGRRRRWATNDCSKYAQRVSDFIYGNVGILRFYRAKYIGGKFCEECGSVESLELDHVVGIAHGGGGGWLSNYRLLCKSCHRKKTNADFGWKNNQR